MKYKEQLFNYVKRVGNEEIYNLIDTMSDYIGEDNLLNIFKIIGLKPEYNKTDINDISNYCVDLLNKVSKYNIDVDYKESRSHSSYVINSDDGFSSDFNLCLKRINKIYNEEFFDDAATLYFRLVMIISTFKETFEANVIPFNIFHSKNLISMSEDDVKLHCCYSIVQNEDICDEHFNFLLTYLIDNNFSLLEILTTGKISIKNADKFMKNWSDFLVRIPSHLNEDMGLINLIYELTLTTNDSSHLERFIETNPQNIYAHNQIIRYYSEHKNISKLIEYATNIIDCDLTNTPDSIEMIDIVLSVTSLNLNYDLYKKAIFQRHALDPSLASYIELYKVDVSRLTQAEEILKKSKPIEHALVRFMLGDYQHTADTVYAERMINYWEGCFKQQLVPLLLLLLVDFSPKCRYVRQTIKQSDEYITISRRSFRKLCDEDKEEVLKMCKRAISNYSDSALLRNERNEYRFIAELVYSLAEAHKYLSLSYLDIIDGYVVEYKRFRIFREIMVEFAEKSTL